MPITPAQVWATIAAIALFTAVMYLLVRGMVRHHFFSGEVPRHHAEHSAWVRRADVH